MVWPLCPLMEDHLVNEDFFGWEILQQHSKRPPSMWESYWKYRKRCKMPTGLSCQLNHLKVVRQLQRVWHFKRRKWRWYCNPLNFSFGGLKRNEGHDSINLRHQDQEMWDAAGPKLHATGCGAMYPWDIGYRSPFRRRSTVWTRRTSTAWRWFSEKRLKGGSPTWCWQVAEIIWRVGIGRP